MNQSNQASFFFRATFLIALALLQGCAVLTVPGFQFADVGSRSSVPLGQYITEDPDNPPQGVIIPITRELVQAQRLARPRDVSDDVKALFGKTQPYTIGVGDVVGIVVYDHPDLIAPAIAASGQSGGDPTSVGAAPGFIVNTDGQISFPFVGRLKVTGLTEFDASDQLAKRLAKYIKNPQVTFRVQAFRSRRAYIEGEVRSPGMQIFTDIPMTLPQAISRAGGITAMGDRSTVQITRADVSTKVDLSVLDELGINPSKILLQNDDLVNVRSRDDSKVYVMGEVARPSALPMRNGRMSLNEALGEAGGPDKLTANTAQIYVIRNNAQGGTALFHLNAAAPTALALADVFVLKPRDVVYVDPVPLVNWNRIISLVLPSAQVANMRNGIGLR